MRKVFKNLAIVFSAILMPILLYLVLFLINNAKDFNTGAVIFLPIMFNMIALLPSYYLLKHFKKNGKIVYILPFFVAMGLKCLIYCVGIEVNELLQMYFTTLSGIYVWLSFLITILSIYLIDNKMRDK